MSSSLTACVNTDGRRFTGDNRVTEPNFFITNGDDDEPHYLTDQQQEVDPSQLLDTWLRELDAASMVSAVSSEQNV